MQLEQVTEIISQEADCCSEESISLLTVKTEEGGGGPFLVLETARWAFEDEQEIRAFADYLVDFLGRALPRMRRQEEVVEDKPVLHVMDWE